MAVLQNLEDHQIIYLLPVHILGRHAPSCDTVIAHPKVSRLHATVSWDGECWLIKDSSSNGTYINNARMERNVDYALKQGDKLHFVDVVAGLWEVVDIEPPKTALLPHTAGAKLVILDSMAILPDEDDPKVVIYESIDGAWHCEANNSTRVLSHGDMVGSSGLLWRFVQVHSSDKTELMFEAPGEAAGPCVEFVVSQDEEHVSMSVHIGKQEFDLGERSHHYLMLLLARQYQQDRDKGTHVLESGWLDKEQLVKMLDMDEIHINMQLYRFKKQLDKAIPQAPQITSMLQRRKGMVRFGCDNLKIMGGMQL